jgi:hypothetical protein
VAALAALLLSVPLASCTDAHALALGVRVAEAPGDSIVVHVQVRPQPGSDSTRVTVTATGQPTQVKALKGASAGTIDFRFANAAQGQTVSGTVVGVTWVKAIASAPSSPLAWSHTRQPLPPTIDGVTVEEAMAIIDSAHLLAYASYYPAGATSLPCHAELREYVVSTPLVIQPAGEHSGCANALLDLGNRDAGTLPQWNARVVALGRATPDTARQRWRTAAPTPVSHVAFMRVPVCGETCPAFPAGALDWPRPPDSTTGTEYVWLQAS